MKGTIIILTILICVFDACFTQGPRMYKGRSTIARPTAAAKVFYSAMSKCQICLTIKYEMKNQTPTSIDICDDSEALRWNADVCEEIINSIIANSRAIRNHCNVLCHLTMPSKKAINRRSFAIKEID